VCTKHNSGNTDSQSTPTKMQHEHADYNHNKHTYYKAIKMDATRLRHPTTGKNTSDKMKGA